MQYKNQLRNFYIPEEQSIYLLNANDAKKLKDWVALCISKFSSCLTTQRRCKPLRPLRLSHVLPHQQTLQHSLKAAKRNERS